MMCRGSGRAIALFTSYNNFIQLYVTHSHAFHSSVYVLIVRGDRDSRATLMPIYGDLYQIKL